MSSEDQLANKLDVIAKLLYMQTRSRIEDLKAKLLKTELQRKAYEVLDGKKTIKEIAAAAGYKDTRALETFLPEWESKGLILSFGKRASRRYVNIENLEI